MKRTSLQITSFVIAVLGILLCSVSPANAQMKHDGHEHTAELGRVNFRVSCTPRAQQQFRRAVAWLHSFEYEEAERAFTEVTITDPQCAMAYWGIAMSNYHPLWAPPSVTELRKASDALAKGKSIGAKTRREQDYLAALEAFYKDFETRDLRTRTFAYSEAMDQLFRRYPTDREAGVFYALTLIATGTMDTDKNYTNEKRAAHILNRVLAREPRHPGVAHYLIHSYDYPALAQLALPAARSYAKIAPASAHAQHMPSHIFTRLGFWPEAVRSNLGAKASAKAYAVRNHLVGAWDEQLHAMDYLAYAYLQGAQDKKALGVLEELYRIRKTNPPNFKVAYAFTAIPARYALERRQWSEAAKLAVHPGNLEAFPWERFRWAEAHIHFARALGAAHTGDIKAARQEVEKLAEIRQGLAEIKGDYDWATQVEIKRQVAAAWLAHAEGKKEESVQLMRAAAELDDATEKHPVTPGAVLPAREQLGELLLELNQYAAALQEFELSLRTAPNRFNSLYGAAHSAKLASNPKKAKGYYAKLLAVSRNADTLRPEIDEAKAFVAGGSLKQSAKMR